MCVFSNVHVGLRITLLKSVHFSATLFCIAYYDTIQYDTIEEFNVDSKAEYSALSSTRSQKKKLKQTTPVWQCPFNTVQVKILEVSPEGIRVTMEERICERDEF